MKNKIPVLIYLFGGLLTVFGLFLAINNIFNADKGLVDMSGGDPKTVLIRGMLIARNLAMALTMAVALFSRSPKLIALAFFMRVVTDTADIVTFFSAGGFANMGYIFLPVLLLEIVSLVALLRISKSQEPA